MPDASAKVKLTKPMADVLKFAASYQLPGGPPPDESYPPPPAKAVSSEAWPWKLRYAAKRCINEGFFTTIRPSHGYWTLHELTPAGRAALDRALSRLDGQPEIDPAVLEDTRA
jgi:hypothetical protein